MDYRQSGTPVIPGLLSVSIVTSANHTYSLTMLLQICPIIGASEALDSAGSLSQVSLLTFSIILMLILVTDYVVSTSLRRCSVQAPRRSIAEYVGPSDDLPQILEDAPRCSSPMTIPYTDDERPYVVRHEL